VVGGWWGDGGSPGGVLGLVEGVCVCVCVCVCVTVKRIFLVFPLFSQPSRFQHVLPEILRLDFFIFDHGRLWHIIN
jgi:hypothetical protein